MTVVEDVLGHRVCSTIITDVEVEMMKLTNRLGDSGCDVRSNEAGDGCYAITDAHQRACVLRRNVHVINEVARVDEAAHANSQHEQQDGQFRLSAVQVTQSNQKQTSTKHTCNQKCP